MKKLFAATVLALGVLGFTSTANAIPIKWTLTDIAFDDDGIATGSFVYDAETDTFSNIRISTTTGTLGTAANLRFKCTAASCAAFPTDLIFMTSANQADMTNLPYINFMLDAALPNSPSTLPLVPVATATCSNATCSGNKGDTRMAFTGSLVGALYVAPTNPASVPTLNQWGLMLLTSLLGGLTFWRQRRKS